MIFDLEKACQPWCFKTHLVSSQARTSATTSNLTTVCTKITKSHKLSLIWPMIPWSRCWVRRIHGHCILVLICCLYSPHLRASSEACICLLHSAFCTAVKENYIRQELLDNPQHKPASRPRAKHPGASCFNLVCANPKHIRNRAKFQGIYSMIPSPQHACCPYWKKVLWTSDTEDCWCNRPGDPISQVSKKANEPVGSNFLRSIRSCTPRTCRFQYTFQDSHQSSLFNLRFFLRNYILALLTPLGSMESIQSNQVGTLGHDSHDTSSLQVKGPAHGEALQPMFHESIVVGVTWPGSCRLYDSIRLVILVICPVQELVTSWSEAQFLRCKGTCVFIHKKLTQCLARSFIVLPLAFHLMMRMECWGAEASSLQSLLHQGALAGAALLPQLSWINCQFWSLGC